MKSSLSDPTAIFSTLSVFAPHTDAGAGSDGGKLIVFKAPVHPVASG
ncbi:MAG: hypothetical protein ABIQ55_08000 [Gemmatimonadaceae bacterium]